MDTVLLFLKEKIVEHWSSEFLGIILVSCVRFSVIRGVPELFWVKNCEKGEFLGIFHTVAEVGFESVRIVA